jgi:hypothetical protein
MLRGVPLGDSMRASRLIRAYYDEKSEQFSMAMAVAFAALGLPSTSEQLQQLSKKLFPDGVYTEEFAKRATREMEDYAEHFASELRAELVDKPE